MKALALTAGGETVVIVKIDAIFVYEGMLFDLEDRLDEAFHGKVILTASHSHSAPMQFTGHSALKAGGGDWPPHCVQNSPGAAFHDELQLPPTAIVVSKGQAPDAHGGGHPCIFVVHQPHDLQWGEAVDRLRRRIAAFGGELVEVHPVSSRGDALFTVDSAKSFDRKMTDRMSPLVAR